MIKLMEWDVFGKAPADVYTPQQMAEARALIADEMETQPPPPLDTALWTVLRECSSELILYQGRYTRLSNLGRREQAEALANKFRVSGRKRRASAASSVCRYAIMQTSLAWRGPRCARSLPRCVVGSAKNCGQKCNCELFNILKTRIR